MVTMRRALWLVGLLVSMSAAIVAADRTHDVTIEDYFSQASIGECALSPNGRQVAYTEARWQGPKQSASSDLWLVDCETKAIQRLTFEPCSDGNPRWSPDGQFLYFTSSPNAKRKRLRHTMARRRSGGCIWRPAAWSRSRGWRGASMRTASQAAATPSITPRPGTCDRRVEGAPQGVLGPAIRTWGPPGLDAFQARPDHVADDQARRRQAAYRLVRCLSR